MSGSHSIFNPINQLNKIGNLYNDAGTVGQIINPFAYAFGDQGHVAGQGLTAPGGALNQALDPLNLFGGKGSGEAQQAIAQNDAQNAAQLAAGQQGLAAALNGGQSNPGGLGSYQPPQPVLAPQLLNSPNRPTSAGQMPFLKQRAFGQVMAPFQQAGWGLQQVNPAYLTGINQVPGRQIPADTVSQPPPVSQPGLGHVGNPMYWPNPNQPRMWM